MNEKLAFVNKFDAALKVINPFGHIGIVTFWSPVDKVIERLSKRNIDLSSETSNVAVIGNLYGGGFNVFLRTLLYNPQITHIVTMGNVFNGSNVDKILHNYFTVGTEPVETSIKYDIADVTSIRVVDTNYIMDSLLSFDQFAMSRSIPEISHAGRECLFLDDLVCNSTFQKYRIAVEAPRAIIDAMPSENKGHSIIQYSIASAWKALSHRILNFGKKVQLRAKERLELQDVKVVITKPEFESEEITKKNYGVSSMELAIYMDSLFDSSTGDFNYTYGNRISGRWGDLLRRVISCMKSIDDRRAYISLWDNEIDPDGESAPCMVSLFFRRVDDVISATATFRSHNVSDAWFKNAYGVLGLLQHVCNSTSCAIGAITIFSQSACLDPEHLEKAQLASDQHVAAPVFKTDPNGYFKVDVDYDCDQIIVRHFSHDHVEIKEYRGVKPAIIQQALHKNYAISDLNHATYVGIQLQKAYSCISSGTKYIQD